MRNVNIEVFSIARTMVDREAVRRWLDHLTFQDYELPSPAAVTDPAMLIALAAKRCYLSFDVGVNPNLTKVRKDMVEYLDNVLKSGHGSVFEHAVYTFAVEGVSRVFTGEMNRHRAGVAISEGSMRYIRFNDLPFWMPLSITITPAEKEAYDVIRRWNATVDKDAIVPPSAEEHQLAILYAKKLASQEIFQRHFSATERAYAELQEIWKEELAPTSNFHAKKQITSMMRRVVPMGVATGGVWSLNMRALRHVLALRATEAAEEEICYVASQMLKIMVEKEPAIFGDFSESPEGFWVPKYPKV